jgi:hypothetical protein
MPDPKKKQAAGTREPIYTSNRNDPRLKAYQDSLTTYNLAPEFWKKTASEYLKSKTAGEAAERLRQVESEFKKRGFIQNLQYDIMGGRHALHKPDFAFDIPKLLYKEPVQPVLYAPERPKVDKAVVKPKNAELSVKKKELKPQKSLPKSVTGFKMDASGANVYLSVNGKQTVMPKKDFTDWLKNPGNRAMYDKYRSLQAKTLKKK